MSEITKYIWTDGTTSEDSLKKIDDNFIAKYGKQKEDIKEVIVGDQVEVIGDSAFKSCKNLVKATISENVKEIRPFAFAWCENLESVNLPQNLDTICISAFTFCASLKKAIIPDNVTLIDDEAFSYCTALDEVKLPANLKDIYVSAFMNCKSLTEVTIPASTKTIDGMAFINCEALETVIFEDDAQLEEISSSAFMSCPKLKLVNQEALTKLKSLGDRAFLGDYNITSFMLPEGVEFIGDMAFAECRSLAGEVTIPSTVKKMPMGLFANCINLENVKFNMKGRFEVGPGMFAGCEKLKTVTGSHWASKINICAFMGDTALEEVALGASLMEIDDWAFKGCINLSASPEEKVKIGGHVFDYTLEDKRFEKAGVDIDEDYVGELYFDNSGHNITKEDLMKLMAFDICGNLLFLNKNGMVDDKLTGKYSKGLLEYTRGDDNEYILASMLEQFDDVYGTEEMPLTEELEILRNKIYTFGKELQ